MQTKDKLYTVEEIENAWGIVGIPRKHGLTKLLDWFITRDMQKTEGNIREGVYKVTDLSPTECDQLITALRFSAGQDIDVLFANAPVETNEKGAKQSRLDVRYDLLSPVALERLAHINWYGAKRYKEWNWRGIPVKDNINHAVYHIYKYLEGDTSEDHLGHAFCRLMFAIDVEAQEKKDADNC